MDLHKVIHDSNYMPNEEELQILRQYLNEKSKQVKRPKTRSVRGEKRKALDSPSETDTQDLVTLDCDLQHLKGALHPVRRCPFEVLQMIFEWTVLLTATDADISEDLSSVEWFDAATRLSHVCRKWRSIALDTPKLWSKLPEFVICPIGTGDNLFWERTLSRIKGYPADICIAGFEALSNAEDPESAYAAFRFHEIPHIRILEFRFEAEDSLEHLFHPSFRIPEGRVDELQILVGSAADVYLDGISLPALLRMFPSLQRLRLAGVSVHFSKVTCFRNITALELWNAEPYSMETLSRQFPNLQRLRLSTSRDYMRKTTDICHFPALQELIIQRMDSFDDFFGVIDCPKLTSFVLETFTRDVIMDFFRRHPTLKRIRLSDAYLHVLTSVAPNITEFMNDYDPSEPLLIDRNSTRQAILPRLEYYTLMDNYNDIDIEKFERLVKSWAAPHLDPQIQLHPECQPLKALTIGVSLFEYDFEDAAWTDSLLYKQAKEVKFERDSDFPGFLFVVMKW